MANDFKIDLWRSHREAQEKYIYFLLAASGASIAFAVTQSRDATISWALQPLTAAILFWGASFYCGCIHLRNVQNIMQQNYDFLRVERGEHPEFPNHPQIVSGIRGIIEETVNKTARWAVWQFRLLIAGACAYIAWHAIQIASRTP